MRSATSPDPLPRANGKAESRRLVRNLEALRNHLAHAHANLTGDGTVVALRAGRVEAMASGAY